MARQTPSEGETGKQALFEFGYQTPLPNNPLAAMAVLEKDASASE